MNKLQTVFLCLLIVALTVYSCAIVPLTGRRQLSLVSDTEMLSMSFTQYDQFMKENKLSTNATQTNMVKNVGRRVQNAVTTYFTQNNMSRELDGFAWEFNLIESKEVNAWCMPGGKVVVYSGLLPVAQNEAGLAVVMGHEIAHAVAKHSNERMSQALIAQLGGQTLSAALQNKSEQTQQIWMSLFGVGAQVGALLPVQPYSGERSGQARIDLHGHGRVRPQLGYRVLAADVRERRGEAAGVPEHAPLGCDPHAEDQGGDARGDEVLQEVAWQPARFSSPRVRYRGVRP